ncbi:hypothetical protein GOB98_21835 [Sinorhizobium meliloti]|nr:hypothetical protein [Sinorhizobium meliloti]MDW9978689.1 hypothetical protein [Sinorhizobium meliloti]
MWPSPCSKRYLNISRTRRISSLSAGIPFLPRHVEGRELHTSRTPTPDAFRWGRHHLGIRGRLFLGIGGRDHFGIRGRIASEFASSRTGSIWASGLQVSFPAT